MVSLGQLSKQSPPYSLFVPSHSVQLLNYPEHLVQGDSQSSQTPEAFSIVVSVGQASRQVVPYNFLSAGQPEQSAALSAHSPQPAAHCSH